jgi:Asp-tRNA(Asn)/Glu-tRNA(Gln) amidotransferase A subunit family amidase
MHSSRRKAVSVALQTDRQTLAPLVAAVQTRALSAAALVDESLRRIESMADLGAVTQLRAAEARADARVIDGLVRGGYDQGPLTGLPVLVKDNEAVAGLPTTFGSLLRVDAEPEARDGLSASLLRAAGAIVVGKTNLPEYAFEGYTDNRAFGPTSNPWDRSMSPGGSSGGSGAALAAGLAPIATATDVGGSIRIPAALCGLVGLKPTAGLIADDPTLIATRLNSHGPLATTVADAELLLRIVATGSPGDRAMWRDTVALTRRSPRLLITERLIAGPEVSEPLRTAFHEAVREFEAAVGGTIEDATPSLLFPEGYESEDWFRIVGYEQVHALGPAVFESGAAGLDPAFEAQMRLALEISLEDHLAAWQRRDRYAAEVDRLLGDDAVLVSPTLTVEGWSAEGRLPGRDQAGLPGWVYNTEPANLTGHPALSVPGGLIAGRPFGLQLIGPRNSDRALLALAAAYERAAPWPLSAPGHPSFTIDALGAGEAITRSDEASAQAVR